MKNWLAEWKTILWCFAGTVFGFYLAGSFNSVAMLIASIIGGGMVFAFAGTLPDEILKDSKGYPIRPHRTWIYLLAVCVLFCGSYFTSAIASSGVEPGDEDSLGRVAQDYIPPKPCYVQRGTTWNVFIALFTPTLVGIRLFVGKAEK